MSSKLGYRRQCPYNTKNGSFYCGYDNPAVLPQKVNGYKNGMKGMMFWDYEGDTMGNLRKAVECRHEK